LGTKKPPEPKPERKKRRLFGELAMFKNLLFALVHNALDVPC
jgi:hypothetical protein